MTILNRIKNWLWKKPQIELKPNSAFGFGRGLGKEEWDRIMRDSIWDKVDAWFKAECCNADGKLKSLDEDPDMPRFSYEPVSPVKRSDESIVRSESKESAKLED